MALQEFNPNQALREIRTSLEKLGPLFEAGKLPEYYAAENLEAWVRKLDEWLSKGGYPPSAWDPFSKQPEG